MRSGTTTWSESQMESKPSSSAAWASAPSALGSAAGAFVDAQRVGHLATADAHGVPHVVPVCFARIDDRVYVAIDEKPKRGAPLTLRRVRNVLAHPSAALVADAYDEDWSRLGFVLLRGVARVLEGGDEHGQA